MTVSISLERLSSGFTSSGASGNFSARDSVVDSMGATCAGGAPVVVACRSAKCSGAVEEAEGVWFLEGKGSGIE